MRRRGTLLVVALLLAGCKKNSGNPFDITAQSKPPSADAVVLFVSSSWTSEPGQPRELMALNADGSTLERLTSCATASPPCDVLQFSLSPDKSRAAVIRAEANGAPGTSTLYFMDLSRSVEKLLFPTKRVGAVDWSSDGSFLLYTSAGNAQSDFEDIFLSQPDGTNDQNLTNTTDARERSPRIDPLGRTAVYERIDSAGAGRIYLYQQTPLTSGPATGPALPGTLYVVGADADPAFSPDGTSVVFRRLTSIGNGGLGTWDLLTVKSDGTGEQVIATGGDLYRGTPDWGKTGIVFVETDAAADRSSLVVIQPDGSGRKVLREEAAAFAMGAPRWIAGN